LAVSGQNQIKVNGTTPFTATAHYDDGTSANVTPQAMWASNAAGICTVGTGGMATGVSEGSCEISATYTAVSGRFNLEVAPDPSNPAPPGFTPPPSSGLVLNHLFVSGPGSITVGQTVTWQARGRFSDNSERDVTAESVWSSASPAIAGAASGGQVTGVSAGNTTIQATYEGQSGSGGIVVSAGAPPTVVSLSVTGNTSIQAGQTSQLQATATMSDGTTQTVTNSSAWVSGTTGVATVSATGLVTGVSEGQALITATYQGQSASVTMQVSAAPPVEPIPTGLTITGTVCGVVDGSSQLQAIVQMSDGTTQNRTATATWTTGNPAVATVVAGLVKCAAVGVTTITATVAGPFSDSVPVTVVAAAKQLIGIRVDVEGNVLTGNGPVGLGFASLLQDPLLTVNVFALFSDGSEENVTALAAVTTSSPLLVVNGPGVVNAASVLAHLEHEIRADASDAEIAGAFAFAVKHAAKAKPEGKRSVGASAKPDETRADATDETAEAARKRMLDRSRNAWRPEKTA
jgi:hypothetical protein